MDARINRIIIDTLRPYKPEGIFVFGSYARNEMTPESDIDIMVNLNENLSLFDMGEIYMKLKENLQHDIDLVTQKGLNPIFKPYIEKDLIQIYSE